MNDVQKKLFAQLDDDAPGQRSAAVDALRKRGVKFRALVQQIEQGEKYAVVEQEAARLRQDNAQLTRDLATYQAANAKAAAQYTADQATISQLRAALQRSGQPLLSRVWLTLRMHPRISGGAALALVVALFVFVILRPVPPVPEPAMSDAAATQLASDVGEWHWSPDKVGPFVIQIAGAPWWVVTVGDQDASSFLDAYGQPVMLRCLRYFARPAVATFGEYVKPPPVEQWAERGRECKAAWGVPARQTTVGAPSIPALVSVAEPPALRSRSKIGPGTGGLY